MTEAQLELDSVQTQERSTGLSVPVWLAVGVFLLVGTAVPIALHHERFGVFNVHQIALTFFFWLNAIIAFWEICLFFRIDKIEKDSAALAQTYRGRELAGVIAFFRSSIPVTKLFSPTKWSEVWSSYTLFDDSYADRKSFGFFIDIGNGFSTLIPSVLFIYGITFQFMSARVLGFITLLISYQMLYGTIIYFVSFVFNKRYRGHTPGNLAIFVGLSNLSWTIFPVWAMGVSIWMIIHDSFAIFGG